MSLVRPPERRRAVVVGYLILLAVAALAAGAVVAVAPPDVRPLALRVVAALTLAVPLLHLRRRALARVAPAAAVSEPSPCRRLSRRERALTELAGAVRESRWSRRYFDGVLWPRLVALAPGVVTPPAPRPFGRGPSWPELDALLAAIERRS
jgi:hypothetical protein